jgi:hypothetical protein
MLRVIGSWGEQTSVESERATIYKKDKEMKKLGILILTVGMTLSSYLPVHAFPIVSMVNTEKADSANVVQVRARRTLKRHHIRRLNRRHHLRPVNRHRYRHGWNRRYNRTGAVAGGLAAGAIVGSALRSGANTHSGTTHTQWCYNRYRSYRATDNTFQPNSGPRQQCISR